MIFAISGALPTDTEQDVLPGALQELCKLRRMVSSPFGFPSTIVLVNMMRRRSSRRLSKKEAKTGRALKELLKSSERVSQEPCKESRSRLQRLLALKYEAGVWGERQEVAEVRLQGCWPLLPALRCAEKAEAADGYRLDLYTKSNLIVNNKSKDIGNKS